MVLDNLEQHWKASGDEVAVSERRVVESGYTSKSDTHRLKLRSIASAYCVTRSIQLNDNIYSTQPKQQVELQVVLITLYSSCYEASVKLDARASLVANVVAC